MFNFYSMLFFNKNSIIFLMSPHSYIKSSIMDTILHSNNYNSFNLNYKVLWHPIFATDFSQLSSVGDGILKVNQAIPGYFDKEAMRVITGIDYGV